MDPTLEPVEELKNTETVTPTKVPRERTEAQKLALSKARERAMQVRSANAELRKKQKAIDTAEKEKSKRDVEEKFDALQKPVEAPVEPEEEEEVVYEKPKKKKRRVVVVQESSSEEEIEVQLPRKKKTKPTEPEPNPFITNRVFAHPGRYG
tara:strand:- start:706 stop:1158 length:453 start_codon:yes stop_codon:yes gene_type:complete